MDVFMDMVFITLGVITAIAFVIHTAKIAI